MRTKSRGMRRNSGYGILRDECSITADDDVGSATAGLHLQDGLSTQALSKTSIAVAPFLDSDQDERVNRNSGARILEDHWSVSADADVGLFSAAVGAVDSHTLVGPSRDVNAFLDSNNGQRIGDSMDVDCPFPYVEALPEVSIARRISNGISINEPGPVTDVGDLRRPWFSGFDDVTGKGKRKLYEIPATDPCETQPMNGDVCQTSLTADRLAAAVSISSSYVTATAIGSQDHCSPPPLHVDASTTHQSELYVPEPPSPSSAVGVQRPILRQTTVAPSVVGSLPLAQPLSSTTTTQRRRRPPRPRQVRTATRSAAPMPDNRGAPDTYVSLGPCNKICDHCKALFWLEERLKHGSARFPEYHRCCMGGKVRLRHQPEYPAYIRQLFTDAHFMENIRAYNSMFAMTSLGVQMDESVNRGRGPYVFKISGQIYHWIGGLCPIDDKDPRFLQLYIFDTENEVANRLKHFNSSSRILRPDIVQNLIRLLDDNNELVRIFRTARDIIAAGNVPDFKIRLFAVTGSRQYELPAGDSIGAIVYEGGPDTGTEYDIIIRKKAGDPERVSKLHSSYMSFQFPLLFIFGEDGFHIGLRLWDINNQTLDEDKNMTMKMYYAYQLHDRFQQYSLLTRAGRLFQQYVVTAYSSVEQYRLDFIREHQDDIRNDYLSGLYDAIARGDRNGSEVGMRTILPASFVGGPRYMYSHYLDALAICRVHGNPSFFITFTCNVRWPEILDYMEQYPDVTVADRPDVVDRVFEQKIHHLITYLRDGRPFGSVAAVLYTVEFQKRGLPHCHLLLWIEAHSRVRTNADIDRYVSAELPDRDFDPDGYRIVTEFMMHGPCGDANRSAVCMRDSDTCTKGFPKLYCNATSVDKKGYVHYRRRATGSTTMRQNVQLDNAYVVPYNMLLLRRFYAHINVEYCEWTMLIKYLFKYISKGTDRIVTQITRCVGDTPSTSRTPPIRVDEIKNYVDARYIGPHEACWRILGFDIHYRDPPVQILAVHLENMQRINFRRNETLESIVDKPSSKKTTLTQWLDFNARFTSGRHLTYLEFPSEFVWNVSNKSWSRRQNLKKPCIGRLAYVHPSAGDLFYQRLLLCHRKGCVSFPDIRTIEDQTYATNRAACEAMGLLAGDGEWSLALVEAALTATASEIRQLFCQILIFCDVTNPICLWNAHWRLMSDDIPRMLSDLLHIPEVNLTDQELQGGVLYELEGTLRFYGKSVTDFDMCLPPPHLLRILRNRTVMEERSYDPDTMANERDRLVPNLNTQQRAVFDAVIQAVSDNRQELIFVYGHGGTGKTFVWKSIIYTLRAQRKIVLAVASSGIAALLLPSGRTAHSRFKLPFDLSNESMCTVKKHTQLADLLMQTDVIIWDEAPMSDRRCFEALDRTLRDLLDTPDHVFGKKSVILGGDFRQTLPVKKRSVKQQIIASCITESYLWKYFRVYTLTENMRLRSMQSSDQQVDRAGAFSQWLLDVGNGTIGEQDDADPENTSWIRIPEIYCIPDGADATLNLIRFIYDDNILQAPTVEALQERAIVCPKNETADTINSEVLQMLSGASHTYASDDTAIPRGNDGGATELLYPTEYLNTLSFAGIPPHNLELKIGAPVMLLRNLNLAGGLCNGTRMIVTQMLARVIEARIITGTRMLQKVFLPRIMLFNREEQLPFIFKRKQFPVKVCYAMTINKSQGQSLKKIGVFLPEPIFGHGQLYVAFSRATSPEGLKILIKDQPNRPSNTTKNIVYRDFLENIVRGQVAFTTIPVVMLFSVKIFSDVHMIKMWLLSDRLLLLTLYVTYMHIIYSFDLFRLYVS